jgi:hypothetical protein
MIQDNNKDKFLIKCIIIPVSVTNGILSGISSVITVYFFKPIWEKIASKYFKK